MSGSGHFGARDIPVHSSAKLVMYPNRPKTDELVLPLITSGRPVALTQLCRRNMDDRGVGEFMSCDLTSTLAGVDRVPPPTPTDNIGILGFWPI